MEATKHIELLGKTATDSVTGLSGVVTAVSFDLYGCVQIILTPPAKDGKINGGTWLDVSRLRVECHDLVMPAPNFENGYIAEGRKGCALKPAP